MRWSTTAWPSRLKRAARTSLGDRHADGVGEALAERSGGGLDAGGVAVLGMARGHRVELAEAPELVEGQRVAAEVEQRVEEHRAVPVREHEAVPVRPRRGRPGRACRWSLQSTSAMSAIPIGMPGWPEFARCTASMASARTALARSLREGIAAEVSCCADASAGRSGHTVPGANSGGPSISAPGRRSAPLGPRARAAGIDRSVKAADSRRADGAAQTASVRAGISRRSPTGHALQRRRSSTPRSREGAGGSIHLGHAPSVTPTEIRRGSAPASARISRSRDRSSARRRFRAPGTAPRSARRTPGCRAHPPGVRLR